MRWNPHKPERVSPPPSCHLEQVSPRTSRKVPRSAVSRLSLPMPHPPGGTSFAPSPNALPKLLQPCVLRGVFRLHGLGGRSAQDDTWVDAIHQAGWKPAPQHHPTELWSRHLACSSPSKKYVWQATRRAGGAAVLRAQRAGAVGGRDEHSCSDRTHAVTVVAVEDRHRLRRLPHLRCSLRLCASAPLRFNCDVRCLRVRCLCASVPLWFNSSAAMVHLRLSALSAVFPLPCLRWLPCVPPRSQRFNCDAAMNAMTQIKCDGSVQIRVHPRPICDGCDDPNQMRWIWVHLRHLRATCDVCDAFALATKKPPAESLPGGSIVLRCVELISPGRS